VSATALDPAPPPVAAATAARPAPARRRAPLPLPGALVRDERLAARAGEGDERAFALLYDRHHQSLYRYCLSMLRHDADAQDAVHEAMLNGYRSLVAGTRPLAVKAWLFRIAHNEAVTIVRRRRPAEELTEVLVGSDEGQREVAERVGDVLADLEHLPEQQRAALLLRELHGLGYDEIAGVLGTSAGNARQAVFKARTALVELDEGRDLNCRYVREAIDDGDGRSLRARGMRAHIRGCGDCGALHASVRRRTAQLGLVPALPAATATSLLASVRDAAATGGAAAGAIAPVTAGVGAAGLTKVLAVAAMAVGGAGGAATIATQGPGSARGGDAPARTEAPGLQSTGPVGGAATRSAPAEGARSHSLLPAGAAATPAGGDGRRAPTRDRTAAVAEGGDVGPGSAPAPGDTAPGGAPGRDNAGRRAGASGGPTSRAAEPSPRRERGDAPPRRVAQREVVAAPSPPSRPERQPGPAAPSAPAPAPAPSPTRPAPEAIAPTQAAAPAAPRTAGSAPAAPSAPELPVPGGSSRTELPDSR